MSLLEDTIAAALPDSATVAPDGRSLRRLTHGVIQRRLTTRKVDGLRSSWPMGLSNDSRVWVRMQFKLNQCPNCRGAVIEIDHYGERLIGCIECNRWIWRGSERLLMELPEEDIEALRQRIEALDE